MSATMEPHDRARVIAWPYRAGGYGTILADPPWHFQRDDPSGGRTKLSALYAGTMSDAQIVALDVGGLAAPQAHLYLWTTEVHLEVAVACVQAWGFERKHSFVWCKASKDLEPQIGMGSYGRQAHELCLFATRGKQPALVHDVPTWFLAPRGAHSAKPPHIHRIAERMSPGPRVELFARRRVPGWRCWGNQVSE